MQGPPGTGKTRTLLAFMEVMVKTPSMMCPFAPILACADTNAAVDNIVEGLVQRGVKVVRLGQPAKVTPLSSLAHSESPTLSLAHSWLRTEKKRRFYAAQRHSGEPLCAEAAQLTHLLTYSNMAVVGCQQPPNPA